MRDDWTCPNGCDGEHVVRRMRFGRGDVYYLDHRCDECGHEEIDTEGGV